MAKSPKRPRDPAQLAKLMIDIASSEVEDGDIDENEKDRRAVERGHAGGLKGGPARAKNMTAAQRKEIAKHAANARWKPRQKS